LIRYVCEVADHEYIVEADTPEQGARKAAQRQARKDGPGTYTVNVAEATDYDLPLIAGEDYRVTVD
jgi:hypothetical protein